MRKFRLSSFVFLGLLAGPAMAADLPVKAPILTPGRVTDEIVRVGVNYRFSSAVIAKY